MKKKISKIEKFRYLLKKNKRFRFVMITLAIALGIVLFGLLSFLMVRLESADKVTAAISVEPEKLDPTFCSDTETETVIVNCFEGLMKIDRVPAAGTSACRVSGWVWPRRCRTSAPEAAGRAWLVASR